METISTIGLDIAKNVFQVHGVGADGQVVVQKQLRRANVLEWFSQVGPCLIGIEACATSHYWARELEKLGHRVRLLPPVYVKPYVRRQKNDRADAAAICEAVSRPSMRVVTPKTEEQQAVQVLHRSRDLLTRQSVQASNAIRAHLAEFGWIFPQGAAGRAAAIEKVKNLEDADLPELVKEALRSLVMQIETLKAEIAKLERQLLMWHRNNASSQRLATIPGIGPVTASAIVAYAGDGKQFRSGREFAAWVGLVPRQNSSGGKDRLGRISKKGNTHLRQLLVLGGTTQIRGDRPKRAPGGVWFGDLLRRKPARLATVAMANKLARVAWAVLTKGENYRPAPVAA